MIVDQHGRVMRSGRGPHVCTHDVAMPAFPEGAGSLPAHEVRRLWPRFDGQCPDCGQRVILYASFEHYIAGDW